ncbi:hypothetical protein COHA_006624 [Chlorella ohadii]|uniref:Glutathione peroxidase n=1 Tax=Chlorella ohadii TaxID=2649997 RepID=A0AAD5DSG0_9CHLO|nr:hypothetical protein COHA_006624 [Chlorella ohadii]
MLRSRSSGLLPITTSPPGFGRLESRGSLRRRGSGSANGLQRALSYVLIAALLGGSLYGVARLGRVGLLGTGSSRGSGDGFPLGTSTGQQQQQLQQHQHPPVHVHEDAPDRRAALEQHAAEAAALGAAAAGGGLHGGGGGGIDAPVLDAGADSEQAELEAEHLARLQALEAQGHDPHTAAHVAAHIAEQQSLPQREGPSLYASNLSAVDIRGNVMRTADLTGKVTIVVNVASHCGFTDANYRGLHRLYERYKAYGLQVIAFPCNQFGEQEPGTHAEIEQFVASHYGAQFPLMSKVEVNGAGAHPLFAWLKQHTPGDQTGFAAGEDIRWNFEKFLIDKHGNAVKRYGSELDYHDLELDVYNELIKF